MARFKKIDVRMYADSKFLALTPPEACGQSLWIYLITGPQTNSIPGLYVAGEAALAEALKWSLEGFRKAFGEVFQEGLAKADWKHRVLWIPNAIKYNTPENPNVVKSWKIYWEEIPECNLKDIARQHFNTFLKGLGKGFAEAFEKVSGKGMANQEQEQEQEQDDVSKPPLPRVATDEFMVAWNDSVPFARISNMPPGRKRMFRFRMQDTEWAETWRLALRAISSKSFLSGQNDNGWTIDADFFLKEDTVARILDGCYDEKNGNGKLKIAEGSTLDLASRIDKIQETARRAQNL